MKKNSFFLLIGFIVCNSLIVRAQLGKMPSQWSKFVSSSENVLVTDTFMYQGFGTEARNNWKYTLSGSAEVFDAREFGVKGQEGDSSLKLPLGSGVEFEDIKKEGYQDVYVRIWFAAHNIMNDEELEITYVNENSITKHPTLFPRDTTATPINVDYGKKFQMSNPFSIRNFSSLSFRVDNAGENTRNGFYGLDRLRVHGQIKGYTLFTGTGSWADKERWSHLPAARARNALIQGSVSLSSDQTCGNLEIGVGSVTIQKAGTLTINDDLCFYQTPAKQPALINLGSMTAAGKVSLTREFPERGVWYFISFPFDVYASGISGFTQKDGTPNNGGNYFYVKYYDSEQRASQGLDADNWVTLSPPASTKPIFQKNKGYLIALDEGADGSTLTFSSKKGAVPAAFGKSASLNIPFSPAEGGVSSAHEGWYLCGNPFPAPMSLSLLAGVPGIGEYAYCYDGNTYQVYELGGGGEIPPFSAFFLKVTDNCKPALTQTSSPAVRAAASPSFSLYLGDGRRADKTTFLLPGLAPQTRSTGKEAYKLMSPDKSMPQIAACRPGDGQLLAVSPIGEPVSTIPLFLSLAREGRYTFSFSFSQLKEAGTHICLIDHLHSDTIPLAEKKTYTFTGTAGRDRERFSLLVTTPQAISDNTSLQAYLQGNTLYIKDLSAPGHVRIVNAEGRLSQRITVPSGNSVSFLSSGMEGYSIVIQSGEREYRVQ